tara:strand:- start:1482 stop:1628 length:147 start_codon:yes stop_codon:yes gene_type:complete
MNEREKIRRQEEIAEAFAIAGVLFICTVLGVLCGLAFIDPAGLAEVML